MTTTEVDSPWATEIVKQMRAVDTYGQYDKHSSAQIVAPFVVTKEQKKLIPIVGDPDEQTMMRVKVFYNAISCMIEKECGLMAIPYISLTHEGFGRSLITVGRLVVFDKTLRDVHRFGFASWEKLEDEAKSILDEALGFIRQYPEVAQL